MAKPVEIKNLSVTEKSNYGDGTTRVRIEGLTCALETFVPTEFANKLAADATVKLKIEVE